MEQITNKPCKHIAGRVAGTVQCANCKFNRVVEYRKFESQATPTAGTVCIADEVLTTKTNNDEKQGNN